MTLQRDHFLSPKLYDQLKFLAQIVLPALGTLYFALAGIWHLSSANEVVGTIVAIDTFLGVVLQISSASYDKSDAKFDGSIDVTETPKGVKKISLTLHGDPNQIEDSDKILFKVNPPK